MSEEEAISRIVREELGIEQLKTRNVKYKEDCDKYESRVVSEDHLLNYLNKGWELTKNLTTER